MNKIRKVVWDWMVEFSENDIKLNGHNIDKQLRDEFMPEIIDCLYTLVTNVQEKVPLKDGGIFRVEFIKNSSKRPVARNELWALYSFLKLTDRLYP